MSNINFEQDARADLDSVNEGKKLSDQVTKLQSLEDDVVLKEEELKELKRKVELLSGEVIPTMMQEMNISTLKLADGSSVEVKPVLLVCVADIIGTSNSTANPLSSSAILLT